MRRGTSTVGFATAGEGEHFSYWVYVDDVDVALKELEAAGANVIEPPSNRPWGERVASVRDPVGTVVHLGAPIRPPAP
jgi:uncharacterized glyoxalase superfamily protein PhnB